MIYAAVLESGNFTVGDPHGRSGLFVRKNGEWEHLGWESVRCFGVAVNPNDADHVVMACGNGVLSSRNGGSSWRVMTDWRITEVLCAVFDPAEKTHLVAGTAYGIVHSTNNGMTWSGISKGLKARFTQTLTSHEGETGSRDLWAGTEDGVYRSIRNEKDAMLSWERDGLVGFAIRQIVTAGNGIQLAATRKQGAWTRRIGGPWTRVRGVPADATCYAAAVDHSGRRLAFGGMFDGVYASDDGGRSVDLLPALPGQAVHALAFDSDGVLWAGTHAEGVYRFDLSRNSWLESGLPRASIRQLLPA